MQVGNIWGSFVMTPQAEYLDDLFPIQDLVNQAMLNIDAP